MGTFERLSIVVIGVILVMILVVAVVTWTEEPEGCTPDDVGQDRIDVARNRPSPPLPDRDPLPLPIPDPLPDPEPLPPSPEPGPFPPDPVPTPPEPSPGPSPEKRRTHLVADGETLSQIAEKYLPSHKYWPVIVKINDGLDPNRLQKGQEILIPTAEELGLENKDDKLEPTPSPAPVQGQAKPGTTYTVIRGDDLQKIAKRVYDDLERWPDIWLANRERIPDPQHLSAGTVLDLPE